MTTAKQAAAGSVTTACSPAAAGTPTAARDRVTVRAGTVGSAVAWGTCRLAPHGDSPRLDAELLLGHVLGLSRAALIVKADGSLTPEAHGAFERLVDQRAAGVPVAYLTGTREFWSLLLGVTPDVLVPRPETEVLVELALGLLPRNEARRVLDLGTGSGAIALAIASERPLVQITAVDVSTQALNVARGNALRLRRSNDAGQTAIVWKQGSWFEAVPGERFDLIVANPPYLADDDPALDGLRAEPALALAAGPTGLECLAAIAQSASVHMNLPGWLLLEHGSGQAGKVAAMLDQLGFEHVRSHADFAGRPRVTLGTFLATNQEPS